MAPRHPTKATIVTRAPPTIIAMAILTRSLSAILLKSAICVRIRAPAMMIPIPDSCKNSRTLIFSVKILKNKLFYELHSNTKSLVFNAIHTRINKNNVELDIARVYNLKVVQMQRSVQVVQGYTRWPINLLTTYVYHFRCNLLCIDLYFI